MKGPVKLSLAVALALAGGNAFALGLGAIQVKSGLNQPLDAEIPVIADSPAEANALTVDLASPEDFERVGLSRSRLTVPIDMSIGTNARGQTVVKVTSKEPVREPLLDFLVVANWPKGKLLREFTILLDPPVTAPVAKAGPATVAPVAEKAAPAPQPLPEKKPAASTKPPRAEPKPPVAAEPKPAKAPPAAPAPAPTPAAQPAAAPGDYGPVAEGETLSEIARATRPDEKTNINQMMLALLKANPKAFYQDNINALRRGAILRIPTNDEIRASGSVREAIEQVHGQNEAWTNKTPVAAPTLVARTGTPSSTTSSPPSKSEAPARQERLALVPPSAGKGTTTADRAGAAGGTGTANADLKGELARTKEALTSREQEASELKSRVKQLEDISAKDQRLISMKDSEIADLQKKLRDLQAKAAATPSATTATSTAAAKPADTTTKPGDTTTRPEQKITAQDIWGDLNAGEKPAAKPSATSAATTSTPTTTTAPSAASTTAPTSTTSTPTTSTPAATETAATSTPATPSASTTAETGNAATTSPSTTASTDASPTTATATPSASTTAPTKPATSTTPIKPTPAAKVTPLAPPAEPFWRNQNVLLGGGAALVLIGLFALMRFMRKPKPAFAPVGGAEADVSAEAEDEELRLRDALQQNPGNTAASLDLLRHYYARGDAAKFEAAAETMHAHLADPNAPEWDEVLAMGAVLAPNHPLFSAVAEPHAGEAAMHHDEPAHATGDEFSYPEPGEPEAMPEFDEARTHVGTFDFEPAREPAPAPAHDDAFDFDLPVHSEETPPPAAAPVVDPEPIFTQSVEEPAPPKNDDIYVGEDAIGTKLDLAKAYLDMGDPEGAKSMLDEVMNEGNDTQKDEARKLLSEIR
jgi:pilus assembly protein FimV